MAYAVPTFDELRAIILADILGQFEGADGAPGSDWYAQASLQADAADGEYQNLTYVVRQFSPWTAEGEFLERWGLSVFGLARGAGETDEAYRVRILARADFDVPAGTAANYEAWALEYESGGGITVNSNLLVMHKPPLSTGRVEVVFRADTDEPIIDGIAINAGLQAHLDARRPVTADVGAVVATPTVQAVTLSVTPEPGYEWDWTGTKTTVAGSTPTVVHLNNVTDLEVGHRIVIDQAKLGGTHARYREMREIQSIDPGLVTVTVSEAFSQAPAAAVTVYPGGPLYEGVRDEVLALFAALDPGDTLFFNALQGLPLRETGAHNATCTVPAADVAAASIVHLFILGALVITV